MQFYQLRNQIISDLDKYINNRFLNIFSNHHHNDRAITVKNSIVRVDDVDPLYQIICNEKDLFDSEVSSISDLNSGNSIYQNSKYSQEIKNRNPNSSNYYKIICNSKVMIDEFLEKQMQQQPGYKSLINSAPQELFIKDKYSEYIYDEFDKGFDLKTKYGNDSFILSRNISLNENETYIYVIYKFKKYGDEYLQMRVLLDRKYIFDHTNTGYGNYRSHASLAHKGRLCRFDHLGELQSDVNVILAGQIFSQSGNRLVVNNSSSDYVSTEDQFNMCKEFIKETLGTKYNIRFNYIEVGRPNTYFYRS
jgi:hypothetical protein